MAGLELKPLNRSKVPNAMRTLLTAKREVNFMVKARGRLQVVSRLGGTVAPVKDYCVIACEKSIFYTMKCVISDLIRQTLQSHEM